MRHHGAPAVIPEYPKFKKLDTEDQELLERYLALAPRKICELAQANFFLWLDYDRTQFTFINNHLCLMINPPNENPYFLEPLGKSNLRETTEVCLKHTGIISRASEEFAATLKHEKYCLCPLRNQFDYVYSVKELAELKGKKFDGKRNHTKRFKRRYPDYEFVPLDHSFKKDALALFEKWFAVRKESRFFPRLAHAAQKNALERGFANFDRLKLIGGAILAEKHLKGFIIGSRLNAETACAHFQYTDPQAPGISQAVLWEACNKVFASYQFINLEQDIGIPGLRQAKLSYHPLRLEKKFEIKFRAV